MIKKSLFAIVFVLFLGLSCLAQETCNKYSESAGGFSFCAPLNWEIRKFENFKYKKVLGKLPSGATPNINIIDEESEMSLSDYVKESLKQVSASFTGTDTIKVVSQSDFAAESLHGYKIVYLMTSKERKLNIIQYFFSGKGNIKFLITATFPASEKGVLEDVFDNSIKTFKLYE
jgi:hypothetical protein